ncbi:VOC family protein [Sporichthya sp.]|uniref:VOC family protein n=1 Tax=Sporichthya sp. TaxID=65475 RepID=UPI00185DAC67|nr:VOC family protein [Sporichthya sp.]MBA3745119.1 VOC family protein [Sporichthya sp.]
MAHATYKDLCIDAVDAHRLGAFYATALGLEWEKDGQDALLRGPTPAHTVWINQVPEGKSVKNRVHIDVHTGDVAELVAAGATIVNDTDFRWIVMTDPEGQEFCAFVRETPPDYKLYEICVDCAEGPPAEAITTWWAKVFGVEAETEDGKNWWWIAKLAGVPFDGFSFVDVPEPKTTKNRVHWDVTGDRDALIAAGATLVLPKADGRGWDVLADPDGNEFCVFAPKD